MRKPVIMPEVGVPAATVSVWFVALGERVYEGDRLVEILIDSVTIDVPAPATGKLIERTVAIDQRVTPGQVLGIIEEQS